MIESLDDILRTLERYSKSELVSTVVILEQTRSLIKARLYLNRDVFIQVYANSQSAKCSYALISNDRRMYGKYLLKGAWHGHTFEKPDEHDQTTTGQASVRLHDFILTAISLAVEHLL
jgi:hypothetical protein